MKEIYSDPTDNAIDRYNELSVSYINTAHLVSGDDAIRGVPTSSGKTATPEDFAFKSAGDVDANSIISQNSQNVNTMPEDIQNMRINGDTATPETEVYRALTGDNGADKKPFLAYGESGLANGAAKKDNMLSKAGRAMQATQAK